jgi:DNA-directed RNA polymerase subunit RPC12/RpoP
MAKKTVGYINLEWVCPNCSNRNPGPQKTCLSCGAPQPANVQFVLPEKQELQTDDESKESAKKGPDIHCPYCGARNPADAEICSQCGGDLKEGLKRMSGQVVGAFKTTPAKEINCPACGQANPADHLKCSNCGSPLNLPAKAVNQPQTSITTKKTSPILIGCGVLFILAAILGLFLIFGRREDVTGQVMGVEWQRSIVVEEFGPVARQGWIDQIPQDGKNLRCETRFRTSSDTYVAGSEEVCGTPYVIDSGTGQGEVSQDCVYNVYDDYCSFEIDEWRAGNPAVLSGTDYSPIWPAPQLSTNQRLGDRSQSYTILFNAEGKQYAFQTYDENLFFACKPGTRWILTINPSLNTVMSIEPAN